jgi:hypothetical protein
MKLELPEGFRRGMYPHLVLVERIRRYREEKRAKAAKAAEAASTSTPELEAAAPPSTPQIGSMDKGGSVGIGETAPRLWEGCETNSPRPSVAMATETTRKTESKARTSRLRSKSADHPKPIQIVPEELSDGYQHPIIQSILIPGCATHTTDEVRHVDEAYFAHREGCRKRGGIRGSHLQKPSSSLDSYDLASPAMARGRKRSDRPVKRVHFDLGPGEAMPPHHRVVCTVQKPARYHHEPGHLYWDSEWFSPGRPRGSSTLAAENEQAAPTPDQDAENDDPESQRRRARCETMNNKRLSRAAPKESMSLEDGATKHTTALVCTEYFCADPECWCLATDRFLTRSEHETLTDMPPYECYSYYCPCITPNMHMRFKTKEDHDIWVEQVPYGCMDNNCICDNWHRFPSEATHDEWVESNRHRCILGGRWCLCGQDKRRELCLDRRDHHASRQDEIMERCREIIQEKRESGAPGREGPIFLCTREQCICSHETMRYADKEEHDAFVFFRMDKCQVDGCNCLVLEPRVELLVEEDRVFRTKYDHDVWVLGGGWRRTN